MKCVYSSIKNTYKPFWVIFVTMRFVSKKKKKSYNYTLNLIISENM